MSDQHDTPDLTSHVTAFAGMRERYAALAKVLEAALRQTGKELDIHSLVQGRVKTLESFAEKIERKKYGDPFAQMTDLCGVRVVTETTDQVRRFCARIRDLFEIDERNSLDKADQLKDSEFGYRSVHFVVCLRKNADSDAILPLPGQENPDTEHQLGGLKAEIQVRTLMQHAWASVVHDNLYKSDFKTLKKKWSRDAARIAALIEDADTCFTRLLEDIAEHKTMQGDVLDEETVRKQVDRLAMLLDHGGDTVATACKMARLWIRADNLDRAEEALKPLGPSQDPRLERVLAEIRIASGDEAKVTHGREDLKRLLADDPQGGDPVGLVLVGRSYGWNDLQESVDWYAKAFAAHPTEPAILRGYLERKIILERTADFLPLLHPALDKALEISRGRADMDTGMPWTCHDIGMLELLRGRGREALEAFAQAVIRDGSLRRVDELIETLRRMESVAGRDLPGLDWAREFLILAKANQARRQALEASKDPAEAARDCLKAHGEPFDPPLDGPVCIVAGGCDPVAASGLEDCRALVEHALADASGTVICAGITTGVSGLVGDLLGGRDAVRLVCRLPEFLPRKLGATPITEHPAYEPGKRLFPGHEFTPLGPLRVWADILASGLAPEDVTVFAFDNAGPMSVCECVIAAALGARIGLMRGGPGQGLRLLSDPFWSSRPNLLPLPADLETLRLFVRPPAPSQVLTDEDRERLARNAHAEYRKERGKKLSSIEPALADWDDLAPSMRESNLKQVDHIEAKLRRVGLGLRKVSDREIVAFDMSGAGVVEELAELEHARWNLERLQDGWRPGDRDHLKKTSPYLVPWNELPKDIKDYDRQAVIKIPAIVKEQGYEVYRPSRHRKVHAPNQGHAVPPSGRGDGE